MANPFHNGIATDAWGLPEADVGEIGAQAFDACVRAINVTLAERSTTAVLVLGAPGSGKTHLMRRLRAALAQSANERLRETLFVYIRLSTTSNMIWRHLRRRIVDDLMRTTADGSTQLESLVYRVLASPGSRGRELDIYKQDWPAGRPLNERAFARALGVMLRRAPEDELRSLDLFDHLEGENALSPGLVKALRRLVRRQDLVLVRAWLRGDSLTEADLNRLGIAEDATEEEDPEYVAREMVLTLARLAGARMPMVLCFDQVEALETTPGELSGFLAFGDAVSTLHDETTNLVLISCMQSSVDPGVFRRANYARIAKQEAHLTLLDRPNAMRLVNARLAAAGPGLIWSPPAEFESVFDKAGLATARSILAKAAELYDRTRSTVAEKSLPLAAFLQQEWDSRVEAAGESIAEGDIDEVLAQGIPALAAATGGKWKAASASGDIDFRLESAAGQIAVSLCNQKNMNSLAARLRRLGRSAGKGPRLVLLRDPRLAIGKNARATRRYLDDLAQAGARVVHPSIEALEALDALRTLLADSRSGDLARDGSPVGPETVQDWVAQNLPSCLARLVEDITGNEPASAQNVQLREDLLSLMEERRLITLADAAGELGQEASLVRQLVLASPDLAGLLEGPPALLYRLVPAAGC